MVFSSLFFVFFFLALNLIAYHFADGIKRKNMVLLGFSLVFYSWGGPKYLLLLLSMVFASWLFALLIDQYREEGLSKIFLICDCVFMLGLLCICKYLTFFSSITNTIFHFPKEIPQIALPIGISFYTFQLLSYITSYKGARSMIMKVERDELVEELLKEYIKNRSWENR